MNTSPWVAIAGMWLVMAVIGALQGGFWNGWMALLCTGIAVLSAILDRVNRDELGLLHSVNRMLLAQVRHYEKENIERHG